MVLNSSILVQVELIVDGETESGPPGNAHVCAKPGVDIKAPNPATNTKPIIRLIMGFLL
jgi:hypothetical protein